MIRLNRQNLRNVRRAYFPNVKLPTAAILRMIAEEIVFANSEGELIGTMLLSERVEMAPVRLRRWLKKLTSAGVVDRRGRYFVINRKFLASAAVDDSIIKGWQLVLDAAHKMSKTDI